MRSIFRPPARDIRVTDTPGVLTEDVADRAIAPVLATLRRVPAAEVHVRSGRWAAGHLPLVRRVDGCRLGIAGFGRIGAALDNVVLQPHHSSGTVETRRAMGRLVRDAFAAHFAGRALPTPVL